MTRIVTIGSLISDWTIFKMIENAEEDYTGPFYVEVETERLTGNPNAFSMLEEFSHGRVNNLDRPDVTIFEFLDQGSAFKGVLVLQQHSILFALTGRNDLVFITPHG